MKWSILGTLWFSVSQNIAIRWLNTQNYTLIEKFESCVIFDAPLYRQNNIQIFI